ncbi:50S ribosomal protein L12 [Thermoproteota archaeon]
MEYIYAALLLYKLEKKIDENTIKAVLQAAGATPDDIRTKALVAALSEVDIGEALKNAIVTQTAAAPIASETAPVTEVKEEEHKEEEALAGLSSLFG